MRAGKADKISEVQPGIVVNAFESDGARCAEGSGLRAGEVSTSTPVSPFADKSNAPREAGAIRAFRYGRCHCGPQRSVSSISKDYGWHSGRAGAELLVGGAYTKKRKLVGRFPR